MFDIITSIFSAIGNFFGFAKEKQSLENSPEMQANAQAKLIEQDKTRAAIDVGNLDLTKLRNDVSE